MAKYKLINGWTRATVMQRVRERNNGAPALNSGRCVYRTDNGNHCFVGCFIPDGHPGFQTCGGSCFLLWRYPDLNKHMPLRTGLGLFQLVHDEYSGAGLYSAAEQWLTEHAVEPGEPGYEEAQ
jgi:hypothetical protein